MISLNASISSDSIAVSTTSEKSPRQPHFVDVILGDHPKQRAIIAVLFLTAVVFAILVCIMFYGAGQNIFDQERLTAIAICWTVYTCVLYAVIRSGFNQRFADKTLSLLQTCVAQTFMTYAYACTGAAHAGMLLIMALIMVFGMFNMKKISVYLACAYTLTLIGLTMINKSVTDPLHYPANIETIYFILCATVLAMIAQLSVELAYMRDHMKMQARQLEAAYLHVRELSTRDELTGLWNRRYLRTLLEQHVERQARGGQEFYLAILDIDHFKCVNDTYGHLVGDEVLKRLSRCTCELLRKTDTIGRWGGEEFLLLLPETRSDQVLTGLRRLHSIVSHLPMSAEHKLYVTFSAGLTKYRAGENINQTLERADKLLYQAKARGRNQLMHDE